MLHPSRKVIATVGLAALIGLVLGLATDVGLFGWALASLLAVYLCFTAIAWRARRLWT